MTDYAAQQRLITALRDAQRYPHAARRVRVIETHISWVLLAGRYAYKVKKAVNLGFLDFTTLDARRFYCAEEIRLNRRLAPQVYLDVVAISGTAEHPRIADPHDRRPIIEYAVRMHRFPAANLMDKLLAQNKITVKHIERLAALIGEFHGQLPPATDAKFGSTDAILRAARQNFEHLDTLPADVRASWMLNELRDASEAEFAVHERDFTRRLNGGWVRECHGDLHLGNVALIRDDPVPFDGIEFNPELRWIDVMNELAFPVMDLLHRGHPAFAFRLLNSYLAHTGDYAGVVVLRFYLAYRATVRAKVTAIRASQPGQLERAHRVEFADCQSHLALAREVLGGRRPALIITHGLPGSGKSTFAALALERLQGIRIRSDVERKRLFGLAALADSRALPGRDIYSADATQRTYARLTELARTLLGAGYPVIVDAAFLKYAERMQFRTLAQELSVPFVIASVQAPPTALRARIQNRQEASPDASEANVNVLELLEAVQEPLRADELRSVTVFTNDQAGALSASPAWSRLTALIGAP